MSALSGSAVLFVKGKHFEFADPRLKATVEDVGNEFLIRVTAQSFAKYVELDLKTADARFSDNYFDLGPGVDAVISVSKDKLSRPMTQSEVRADLRLGSLYDTFTH